MKRYALLQGSIVANVVEQDDMPTVDGTWIEVTDQRVGPGFAYDEGVFTAPVKTSPRHITQLAFLSRFTDAEAIAIDLASIGATIQAATMRRYMQKVNAAKFIDLDREDTRGGVQALEATGVITAGRAAEILDVQIQPFEVA